MNEYEYRAEDGRCSIQFQNVYNIACLSSVEEIREQRIGSIVLYSLYRVIFYICGRKMIQYFK